MSDDGCQSKVTYEEINGSYTGSGTPCNTDQQTQLWFSWKHETCYLLCKESICRHRARNIMYVTLHVASDVFQLNITVCNIKLTIFHKAKILSSIFSYRAPSIVLLTNYSSG
jgi:hypothetical protein